VATMKVLTEPGFVETAAAKGEYLFAALRALAEKHPKIVEVRGRGLMAGIECADPVAPAISALLDAGIICGPAGPNVIRFLPPLIVSEDDIDRAADTLDRVLGALGW